jgi:hypothetical protein
MCVRRYFLFYGLDLTRVMSSLLQSVTIVALNLAYVRIATRLNNYENHRTVTVGLGLVGGWVGVCMCACICTFIYVLNAILAYTQMNTYFVCMYVRMYE